MCSCSTKERASSVIETETEAEEEGAEAEEGAGAEVTGTCDGKTSWQLSFNIIFSLQGQN